MTTIRATSRGKFNQTFQSNFSERDSREREGRKEREREENVGGFPSVLVVAGYPAIYIAVNSNIDSSRSRGVPRNRLRQQQPAGRDSPSPSLLPENPPFRPRCGAFFGVESVPERIIACLQCATVRGYTPTVRPPTYKDTHTRKEQKAFRQGWLSRQPRSRAQLLITRLASDVHPEENEGKEGGSNPVTTFCLNDSWREQGPF